MISACPLSLACRSTPAIPASGYAIPQRTEAIIPPQCVNAEVNIDRYHKGKRRCTTTSKETDQFIFHLIPECTIRIVVADRRQSRPDPPGGRGDGGARRGHHPKPKYPVLPPECGRRRRPRSACRRFGGGQKAGRARQRVDSQFDALHRREHEHETDGAQAQFLQEASHHDTGAVHVGAVHHRDTHCHISLRK